MKIDSQIGPALLAAMLMARPVNVLMACASVALGYWLGAAAGGWLGLALCLVAAASAVGFGNVVNDLADVATDRVSHPNRPLPSGAISAESACWWASTLAALAIGAGFARSLPHGVAVLVPLVLLFLYAVRLKAVPLAGNLLVAGLVAYPLLFGAIGGSGMHRLWLPALLALLLNLQREVVKDLQDEAGDRAAGLRTSAALPLPMLRTIVGLSTAVYLAALFMPWVLGHFGRAYALVCGCVVLPLHLSRSALFFRGGFAARLGGISLLVKLEMLAGLVALGLDQLVR